MPNRSSEKMQPSEILIVAPAVSGLWEVTQSYAGRKLQFLSKEEAERYAREQARRIHPSEVHLLDAEGRLVYREMYSMAAASNK